MIRWATALSNQVDVSVDQHLAPSQIESTPTRSVHLLSSRREPRTARLANNPTSSRAVTKMSSTSRPTLTGGRRAIGASSSANEDGTYLVAKGGPAGRARGAARPSRVLLGAGDAHALRGCRGWWCGSRWPRCRRRRRSVRRSDRQRSGDTTRTLARRSPATVCQTVRRSDLIARCGTRREAAATADAASGDDPLRGDRSRGRAMGGRSINVPRRSSRQSRRMASCSASAAWSSLSPRCRAKSYKKRRSMSVMQVGHHRRIGADGARLRPAGQDWLHARHIKQTRATQQTA